MGPNPLEKRLQQWLMKFILNGERYSLKPWRRRFQPGMVTDLRDEVIVPLPAKARDHGV